MSTDDPDKWSVSWVDITFRGTAYNTGIVPIRLRFDHIPQGTPEYEALLLLWRSFNAQQKAAAEQQAASGTQGDFFYG